jgi:hypothetical protein
MALSLSDIISGKAASQEQPPPPALGTSGPGPILPLRLPRSLLKQPSRLSRPIPVLGSSTYQQILPGRGRRSNRAAANPSGNRGGFRGNSAGRRGARSSRVTSRFQPDGSGYFGYRSRGGYDGGYGYY